MTAVLDRVRTERQTVCGQAPSVAAPVLRFVQANSLDERGVPSGWVRVPVCVCGIEKRSRDSFLPSLAVLVAVSLAGVVHLLNIYELRMALHLSGREFVFGGDPETLSGAVVEGLVVAGVDRVREQARQARVVDLMLAPGASGKGFLREYRQVWGSRNRGSRVQTAGVRLVERLRDGLPGRCRRCAADPVPVDSLRALRAQARPLGVAA